MIPVESLPDWLPTLCANHLGAEPVEVLFRLHQMSAVFGLRLSDGAEAVVKSRPDGARTVSCVAAQTWLAKCGFPVARPLTAVFTVGSLVVHAEEHRAGGDMMHGDSPEVAARYADLFAWLMAELADMTVAPPLPNPRWVRWDHTDPGLWPAINLLDDKNQDAIPAYVVSAADRVHKRLMTSGLPSVLGHADFEARNIRWQGDRAWAVHDWDSLAWQPEAALVGAASGAFASGVPPTLAPIDSSEAFLRTYQERRGRAFNVAELQVAWAASVWPAAHNARWEALHGSAPICGSALKTQAAERLRRANA